MIGLEVGRNWAEEAKAKFAPFCEPGKCVIAGSIRREKDEVKDIELVCQPSPENEVKFYSMRDAMDRDGFWRLTQDCCNGPRFFQREKFAEAEGQWIKFDVFVVLPPAQWGVILAIRTGSSEFNQRIMNRLPKKGLRCADGQLFRVEKSPGLFGDQEDLVLIPTPEETDYFAAIGMEWIEPKDRR